jgi:ATP citrate (pro-S)-lyase
MQYGSIEEAVANHPKADVFINFASCRSAYDSSLAALRQPTLRVVAIIAEGVSVQCSIEHAEHAEHGDHGGSGGQPHVPMHTRARAQVPERDTKQLIAFSRSNGKILIGPATVGGIQAGEPLLPPMQLCRTRCTLQLNPNPAYPRQKHR